MAQRRDRVLLAGAVAAQLVVLYLPRVDTGGVDGPGLDKLAHAGVFAAVAWTGRRAGVPVRLLVALLVLQAIGSELVQGLLLPDRSGDLLDVLADLAGVALGTALPLGPGPARAQRSGPTPAALAARGETDRATEAADT